MFNFGSPVAGDPAHEQQKCRDLILLFKSWGISTRESHNSGTNSQWKCLLRPSILCCLYQAMACGINAQDFMSIPAGTRALLVTIWAVWSCFPNGSTWAHNLHWGLMVYLHINHKIALERCFETASLFLFGYSCTQTFSAVSRTQRRL